MSQYNPLGSPSVNLGSPTFNPNAPLFGTSSAGISTSSVNIPMGTTTTMPTNIPPANATAEQKNDMSGLTDLFGLINQGSQIFGAVRNQRELSGAGSRRQSLLAQCGRAPLAGRERKEEYRKCKASYNASLLAPVGGQGGGDVGNDNKNIGGQGGLMKIIFIGVGVLAIGAIAFLALKKK